MFIMRRVFLITLLLIMSALKVNAAQDKDHYYRNFWSPQYHARYLSYCSCEDSICGKPVADRYCRTMGYQKAEEQIIAHNVGLTYSLDNEGTCRGWKCNGFKLIKCAGELPKNPKIYSYRKRQFTFPRLENYRIDWCYEGNKGCGERAAYSFCRRLGYLKANHYAKESHVPATKALGDQKLCFGDECNGFKEITCYR